MLFPFTLRDMLLRTAAAGFYQLRWSEEILEEMTRNLVRSGTMKAVKSSRLRTIMERAFPDAAVADYASLVPAMRNDEKDRHVAAAAVKAGAQVIVTSNLQDFRDLPNGIEAQSPDEFLSNLLDLHPAGLIGVLREQAADLVNPPMSFEELLDRLARVVPEFVAAVRDHLPDGAAEVEESE